MVCASSRASPSFSRKLHTFLDELCFCLRLFLRASPKTVSILCHGVRLVLRFSIVLYKIDKQLLDGVRAFLRLFIVLSKRHIPPVHEVSFLRLVIKIFQKSTSIPRMVCVPPAPSQNTAIYPKDSIQAFECPGGCPVFSKNSAITIECLRFRDYQKHITMDAMAVGGVEKLQRKLCMAGLGKFVMNITWPVAVLQSCSKRKHVVHKTPRNGWHD